jgi:hypothetical protein
VTTLITIITAFSAGFLAAGLGAATSIVMTAFMILAGMMANIAGADYNIVTNIGFGLFLGPQVAFGPACAAAVYAFKKGYMDNGGDIFKPLITLHKPDVMVVGGIFGILGWYINIGLGALTNGTLDTVASTVVIVSLLGKVLFTGTLFGKVPEGKSRFSLDAVSWLPYQSCTTSISLMLHGMTVGAITSYFVYAMCTTAAETGNTALVDACGFPVWAIAVIGFLAMCYGYQVPIYHHIAFGAVYASKMAFQAGGGQSCILWGIAFGLLAAYLGDFLAKVFFLYGDAFIDPPSMTIAAISILPLGILPALGLNNPSNPGYYAVPVIILVVLIVLSIYLHIKTKERGLEKLGMAE